MRETIEWVPVAERLPDDELTVLLYKPGADADVWPGWRVGHAWRWADGSPVRSEITHWAAWPAGPVADPLTIAETA